MRTALHSESSGTALTDTVSRSMAATKLSALWRGNPWWIPPFLGRVPGGVEPSHLRVLGMVSLALLFEEYDASMLISALRHIASDLGMDERNLGLDLALVRLGAVPAFFLVPLADRIGRRPVFLASTVALGVATAATGFAQTAEQFVWLQALTRTFFVTSTAVTFVIVTEELPAANRGWGMGMLAALGACGHGLGAILFSQIDRLPFGWRALYVIGIAPVLCLPWFLRYVPETQRFHAHNDARGSDAQSSLRLLVAQQPLRALGLSLAGFAVAAALLPSFQLNGYFAQQRHGFTPGGYSAMVLAGGAIGIVGNVAAGRMGDAFGRRRVGFTLLALFPLTSYAFYNGNAVLAVLAWIPMVFCSMGGRIILRALSTELFPTSHRGAASGLFTVMETLGAVAGLLLLHFAGTQDLREIARVVPLVSGIVLVAACCLLVFPETRQRELEEISAGHGA
jgi:MFS family permease